MILDQSDITNIQAAIAQGGNIWENKLLEEFKRKIKNYYRGIKDECCYCKKNFLGEFNMVIDIEHILPKSKFNDLMFAIYNLNIACKRCNMNIKRERTDYLLDISLAKANPQDSKLYKFIHPNLDLYHNHLKYFCNIRDQKKAIKYTIVTGSSKGQFTYDYFKLQDLEIDSLNQAQGLKEQIQLSDSINPDIASQLENIFKIL